MNLNLEETDGKIIETTAKSIKFILLFLFPPLARQQKSPFLLMIDDLVMHCSGLRSSVKSPFKHFLRDSIAPGSEIVVDDVEIARSSFFRLAASDVFLTNRVLDKPFVVEPGGWLAVFFPFVIPA